MTAYVSTRIAAKFFPPKIGIEYVRVSKLTEQRVSRRKVVEIQLADCLDVSPEAIYDVVTAKNPSLCNIKICKSQLARIFQLVVDTHTQLKPRTFDPDLLRMSTTLKLERRLEEAEAEAEEAPAAPAEEGEAEEAPAEAEAEEGEAEAEQAPAEAEAEEGEAEEGEAAPAAPAEEAEAEGESLYDPKFDVPLDDSDREMLLKLETMHKDGDADDHVDWLDEIQDDDGDLDAERDLVADLDDGLDNLDDDLYDDDIEQDLWVPGGDHNTRHVLPHIPNLKGPKPDVFFSPRIADPTSHPHKGRQRYETRDSHEDLLASGILAKGVFASMLVDIDQE